MTTEHSIELPPNSASNTIVKSPSNAFVIIGANGSGKTRLGVWIEQNNLDNSYRITAQRSLQLGVHIQLKGTQEAIHDLEFGDANNSIREARYGWDNATQSYNPLIAELNDFEKALSALLAKQAAEADAYLEAAKAAESDNLPKPPETIRDKLYSVWNAVFPHRSLEVSDGQVNASIAQADGSEPYQGRYMSDGERQALYLIAQVLCVPEGRILIVDEPEIHLHRSIIEPLWAMLEAKRPDLTFVYITHDTQFAASHSPAAKLWVKSFDGNDWKIERIESSDLPEQLLLDILGSRKKVLFVEGEKSSYDYRLYSKIYSDYYVVPCGNCEQVASRTKALQSCKMLHDKECYGIVDRDYRTEKEIAALASKKVYTLPVAEIENLLIASDILDYFDNAVHAHGPKMAQVAKDYIIDGVFRESLDLQISAALEREIHYQLETAPIIGKSTEEISSSISSNFTKEKLDALEQEISSRYRSALGQRDYDEILKLLNDKSILEIVAKKIGLPGKAEYIEVIENALRTDNEGIVAAFKNYLPMEIPTDEHA